MNGTRLKLTAHERREMAHRIEIAVWRVTRDNVRDDIDGGQLRFNIMDAIDAALLAESDR